MKLVTRHDYLGRSWECCRECGEEFIYQQTERDYAVVCAGCVRRICYEPWNHAFDIFRALRREEQLHVNGFQAEDPSAAFSIANHVEFGSAFATQFISMTYSMVVAAFFAVKGFHERNVPARIAVASVGEDCFEHKASSAIPLGRRTAWNFANRFKELVYTEEQARRETTIDQVLVLDPTLLQEFRDFTGSLRAFEAQYEGSALKAAIEQSRTRMALRVKLDLVELQRYADERPTVFPGSNARDVLRIVFDDGNGRNNGAIRVDMRESSLASDWYRIGYLSREHAWVCRRILEHSDNRYRWIAMPDLSHGYDETNIELGFVIPSAESNRLRDDIDDVCAACCVLPLCVSG